MECRREREIVVDVIIRASVPRVGFQHFPELICPDAFHDPIPAAFGVQVPSSRSHWSYPAGPNGLNGQDAGQLNSLFRLLPQSTELMSPLVAGQGRMPLGDLVAIDGQG